MNPPSLACDAPPVSLGGIRPICVLFLLIGVLALAGCSGAPSWLEGNWQIDHDRTQKEMAASNAGSGGGILSGLNSMIGGMLLPQLDGMQILITSKDRVVMINGQGKSEPYEIINRSSDQCTLKLGDGTVETYYRDGNEIYSYGTGSAHFKFYLMRQP